MERETNIYLKSICDDGRQMLWVFSYISLTYMMVDVCSLEGRGKRASL